MRVGIDKQGRAYSMGSDGACFPGDSDQVDNAVGDPRLAAENMRKRARVDEQVANVEAKRIAGVVKANAKTANDLRKRRSEVAAYAAEAITNENGGENPMLYAAAIQSMSGVPSDWDSIVGGNGLTADGRPSPDRVINGLSGWLDDIKATVSDVASIGSDITGLYSSVGQIVSPHPSADEVAVEQLRQYNAAMAASQASSLQAQATLAMTKLQTSLKSATSSIPGPKIAGVPLLLLLVPVAGAGVYFAMKKKKK